MSNVIGSLGATRTALGRYVGLVSVLPSTLLVVYSWVLVSAGAWAEKPDWDEAFRALAGTGIGEVALILLLSITIGIVLHPLQFTMVQILEGYWGLGRPGVALRGVLIAGHRHRRHLLEDVRDIAESIDTTEDHTKAWLQTLMDEADRLLTRYPRTERAVMPTRLGNVLRRYEEQAGEPYGMNGPAVVPHLAGVAPPEQLAYLNDQRSMLDLAVRCCVTAWLAFGVSIAFLWDDGGWLLLALAPYGAAYLCYRGSVTAAEIYGIALCSLVALNRFTLYDRLRLKRVHDSTDELAQNKILNTVLVHFEKPATPLEFEHPPIDQALPLNQQGQAFTAGPPQSPST